MCDPVSIIGGVASAVVGSMMQPDRPSMPAPQAIAAPQASQAPNVSAVQAGTSGAGQGGGAPGVSQTFLTGPSGVSADDLKLGKSTLLGS